MLRLILLTLGWLTLIPAQAQEVRASLDKDTIFTGETVLLSITVQGEVGGESPEVGDLTTQFEILGSQSQTQVQIINNQQTIVRSWQFELEPKRVGTLTIPALRIGAKLKTNPLSLSVLPTAPARDISQDLFIEVDVEPIDPYVQQQVRYRERIFIAVPLAEANQRREGVLENAILQPLGDQKRYVEQQNGRNYQVFERNFALIPEKSGELTLPQVSLYGRIGTRQPGQFTLNRGRRVQVSSNPITLQVKPRPASYVGQYWLPSADLQLTEEWMPEPPQFRVGEPVTRTITITAKGLDANQLPPLQWNEIDGINSYPDQPQSNSHNENGWLIGQFEQKVALVPTAAGEFTLPQISLNWWDTEQDQAATARLPARVITVLPVGSATQINTQEPLDDTLSPVITEQPAAIEDLGAQVWRAISISLLAIWLLTLLAWQRERRRINNRPQSVIVAPEPPSHYRQQLQKACEQNDVRLAARSLLRWARASWPDNPPNNLGAIARRCPHLAQPILALDRALYDQQPAKWDGKQLLNTLPGTLQSSTSVAKQRDELTPLYLN